MPPIQLIIDTFLILLYHLRLGIPSGLFHSEFLPKTLYALLTSPIRATGTAYIILLDLISQSIFGEEFRI
jgi:hypothetical protein